MKGAEVDSLWKIVLSLEAWECGGARLVIFSSPDHRWVLVATQGGSWKLALEMAVGFRPHGWIARFYDFRAT